MAITINLAGPFYVIAGIAVGWIGMYLIDHMWNWLKQHKSIKK